MIEKSCLQKYIEALMTVAKKNGEKVKIDNKNYLFMKSKLYS